MPELPEVEVVRAGLAPALDGAVVEAVEVLDARSLKRHRGADFAAVLTGAMLAEPRRRGKFLWVPLAGSVGGCDPAALMVHLGMSGQLLLRAADAPRAPLTRVLLWVRHPEHGELRVDFVDQRVFGSMAVDALVPAVDAPGELVPSQVAHIARDVLDARFDEHRALALFAAKSSGIKRVLLDQTVVSGIGNIYADEALWAARINAERAASALSRQAGRRLLAEVREVMLRALAEGGTSFDAQYVNVNGRSGYFSRSLNVYGRAGEPCPRCGTPIVRVEFMNRGSHFCPRCQRPGAPKL